MSTWNIWLGSLNLKSLKRTGMLVNCLWFHYSRLLKLCSQTGQRGKLSSQRSCEINICFMDFMQIHFVQTHNSNVKAKVKSPPALGWADNGHRVAHRIFHHSDVVLKPRTAHRDQMRQRRRTFLWHTMWILMSEREGPGVNSDIVLWPWTCGGWRSDSWSSLCQLHHEEPPRSQNPPQSPPSETTGTRPSVAPQGAPHNSLTVLGKGPQSIHLIASSKTASTVSYLGWLAQTCYQLASMLEVSSPTSLAHFCCSWCDRAVSCTK